MIETDICIIGSGPAGMAAARCAAEGGADVLVLDEQATPGGQIYRAMAEGGLRRADLLGTDYGVGVPLVEGMNHAGIRRQACSTVWWVDGEGTVAFSVDGKADKVRAKRIIVAAGATERPFPFPGWTLPGVMMCGAAQILMKANGVVVKDAVLAGSGPLLYLVAQQLIAAGAPPKALVETQEFGSMIAATRHAFGALRGWRQIVKGLGMLYQIRRAGVRRFTGAKNLRAVGDGRIEALTFRIGGREERIECSTLLLHQGVVPNVQITRALRVAHDWDARQFCWKPRTDAWGTTELSNVAVAGDSGGIAGAKAAEPTGRLAALEALRVLGRIDTAERDRRSIVERRALAYELAAAAVPRYPLSAVPRGIGPVGRHAGLPVRGSDGGRDPRVHPSRQPGAEPGQGVRPFGHGAVPGPLLRSDRRRNFCRRNRPFAGGYRLFPHPESHQGGHPRRIGRRGRNNSQCSRVRRKHEYRTFQDGRAAEPRRQA